MINSVSTSHTAGMTQAVPTQSTPNAPPTNKIPTRTKTSKIKLSIQSNETNLTNNEANISQNKRTTSTSLTIHDNIENSILAARQIEGGINTSKTTTRGHKNIKHPATSDN